MKKSHNKKINRKIAPIRFLRYSSWDIFMVPHSEFMNYGCASSGRGLYSTKEALFARVYSDGSETVILKISQMSHLLGAGMP